MDDRIRDEFEEHHYYQTVYPLNLILSLIVVGAVVLIALSAFISAVRPRA